MPGHMNADIGPESVVLDVVSRWPGTQQVFHAYDKLAGVCIMCHALFEPLAGVARLYGLNLDELLADLRKAAGKAGGKH